MSARPIIAGVDAVTLYEDRAQVTRLGEIGRAHV